MRISESTSVWFISTPAGNPACPLIKSTPDLDLASEMSWGWGHTGLSRTASCFPASFSLWSSLLPLPTQSSGFDLTTEASGSLQMLPCLNPVSEAVILWCLEMVYHDCILNWLLLNSLVEGCRPSSHQLSKFQCHSKLGYSPKAFLEDSYSRHIAPNDLVFICMPVALDSIKNWTQTFLSWLFMVIISRMHPGSKSFYFGHRASTICLLDSISIL